MRVESTTPTEKMKRDFARHPAGMQSVCYQRVQIVPRLCEYIRERWFDCSLGAFRS